MGSVLSSREYNTGGISKMITSRSTKYKLQSQKAAASVNEAWWKWIKENINMRKCIYYMPSDDENNKEICKCGTLKKDHDTIQTARANEEWNVDMDTVPVPTNAFGKIQFDDDVANIERKFVRVDIKTEMPKMMTMMKMWGMEEPNVIISVTGDEEDFKMDTRVQLAFESGLMKAAHNMGAWIITGGTYAGVVKNVGEAVRKNPMNTRNRKPTVAIGIAPWGVIQNRRDLELKEGTSEPAKYHINGKPNSNECFLDPNHSHYILVDDGIQHKIETENDSISDFRVRLEQAISKMTTDKKHDVLPVLVLIMVLGGRSRTLTTVNNALKDNTPVVIIEGSGGAADILAYAFKHLAKVEDYDKDNEGQANMRFMNANSH